MGAALQTQLAEALARLPQYLSGHVLVSVSALLIGLAFSFPLALLALRRPIMRRLLLGGASVVQTIPGLALLALFYPLLLALAAPAARAPAPIAAPATMPAATPASPVAAPETPVAAEGSYTVQRGDTLYSIAGALSGGDRQATQRMMVGLFRANPEAFAGNMNVMRAGAILRVPGATEIADITASDASSEVSRQTSAWRAAGGGAAGGRLRLVTPAEGAADAGTAQAESSGAVRSQIDSLQQDIEEQRRLLELRNQELARLQQELSRTQAAEKAAADQAAADQAAADRAAAEQAAEAPVEAPAEGETAVAPEDDVGREAAPPAEAPRG